MADNLNRQSIPRQSATSQPARQDQGYGNAKSFLPEEVTPRRSGMTLSEYLGGLSDQEKMLSPKGMYAAAVDQSLDLPVISVSAVADKLGLGSQAEQYEFAQAYPNGYMSPRQYVAERAAATERNFLRRYQSQNPDAPIPPGVARLASGLAQSQASRMEDVAGVLAGTLKTNDPATKRMAGELRATVAAHAPGGQFANFGQRTVSEGDQMRQEYGPQAEFMLTKDGAQNHQALRTTELWSAQDENYLPAGTMAQVQRGLAPLFAYPYNAVTGNSNENAGEPWDEMRMIAEPDGKLQYAATMFARGANDPTQQGPVPVYDPEGRARYSQYDLSGSPAALATATATNQSFPFASWKQNVGYPIMEIGNSIGNRLAGGDTNYDTNIRELRNYVNRITPEVPDGVDPAKLQAAGQKVNDATTALTGYTSAYAGPKFADAYNQTFGQFTDPMKRTYLSPAAQTVIETPGEMLGDLGNAVANTVFPVGAGVFGAARGGATAGALGMARSAAKAPLRFVDDFGEEQYEGAGMNAAIGSIADYISPEKNNLLMGSADPNAPGFDQAVERESIAKRADQLSGAAEYGQLINRKPSPVDSKPVKSFLPTMLLSR